MSPPEFDDAFELYERATEPGQARVNRIRNSLRGRVAEAERVSQHLRALHAPDRNAVEQLRAHARSSVAPRLHWRWAIVAGAVTGLALTSLAVVPKYLSAVGVVETRVAVPPSPAPLRPLDAPALPRLSEIPRLSATSTRLTVDTEGRISSEEARAALLTSRDSIERCWYRGASPHRASATVLVNRFGLVGEIVPTDRGSTVFVDCLRSRLALVRFPIVQGAPVAGNLNGAALRIHLSVERSTQ